AASWACISGCFSDQRQMYRAASAEMSQIISPSHTGQVGLVTVLPLLAPGGALAPPFLSVGATDKPCALIGFARVDPVVDRRPAERATVHAELLRHLPARHDGGERDGERAECQVLLEQRPVLAVQRRQQPRAQDGGQ